MQKKKKKITHENQYIIKQTQYLTILFWESYRLKQLKIIFNFIQVTASKTIQAAFIQLPTTHMR